MMLHDTTLPAWPGLAGGSPVHLSNDLSTLLGPTRVTMLYAGRCVQASYHVVPVCQYLSGERPPHWWNIRSRFACRGRGGRRYRLLSVRLRRAHDIAAQRYLLLTFCPWQ